MENQPFWGLIPDGEGQQAPNEVLNGITDIVRKWGQHYTEDQVVILTASHTHLTFFRRRQQTSFGSIRSRPRENLKQTN